VAKPAEYDNSTAKYKKYKKNTLGFVFDFFMKLRILSTDSHPTHPDSSYSFRFVAIRDDCSVKTNHTKQVF
jgi:hypothetical protein